MFPQKERRERERESTSFSLHFFARVRTHRTMRAVPRASTATSGSEASGKRTRKHQKQQQQQQQHHHQHRGKTHTRRDALVHTILLSSPLTASNVFNAKDEVAFALENRVDAISESAETIAENPSQSNGSRSNEPFGNKTFMEGIKDKDYGKSEVIYPDFTRTASGLQYKEVRAGAKDGKEYNEVSKTAVVDWDGYTLGYYGRPFEARNGPKGGAFDEDKDYFRFRADDSDVLPAFREAIMGMKVGAIRRIIVPPHAELGYPENRNWKKMKPKPNNFSGERALGFVMENQGMIDKTLLFDIELMDVR